MLGFYHCMINPTVVCTHLCSHEDGSVRFWDVSVTRMHLMYKLSTSSIFGINTSPTQEAPKTPDGEDEWPPFRKVVKSIS